MQNARLDQLLEGIHDYARRAEIREFISAPQDEQLLALYLKLDDVTRGRSKTFQEHLYEMGAAGAFIAYVLFDRGKLPGIGGD